MKKSLFAESLTGGSGIETLMDDLGHALAEGGAGIRMLGGGNPALIPEVNAVWRRRMEEILGEGDRFDRMMTVYDPPKGNTRFALALAAYLQREYGWDVGAEHIGITCGGQAAFFRSLQPLCRRVLRRPAQEGAAARRAGIHRLRESGPRPGFLHGRDAGDRALRPACLKYRVDFDRLKIGGDIGAICASRPTNPSGNVLTDAEVARLDALSREAGVPLLLDNAYGEPFPGIVFTKIQPVWNENIVLTFSLSKLGLPGTRTGIVVARPEIIRALTSMNAIIGLANGTIGQAIVTPLLESGEIRRIATDLVRPFYERKAANARRWVAQYFDDALDYHVHASEGALFLWLWFRGLPISSAELYERLKKRGVLVVPGHYFAIGSAEAERHASECIRVSFAMDDAVVEEGIAILADEVARVFFPERKIFLLLVLLLLLS